ncbi:hypothetical protein TNIN_226291 [Trichonephila inaurata madagascariensis]|uniref:Uncharacterized protein n=1 Tax=Trichonephila inaurata madagascariensis TaxID=2747483 RepID=A0A8X6Y010_9ARAC|nr:hypothetical protein TNIN_226291 [Trichonephila inaurata madagascariensis]
MASDNAALDHGASIDADGDHLQVISGKLWASDSMQMEILQVIYREIMGPRIACRWRFFKDEHLHMILLPNCILKDFTRTNILDCPIGAKVLVHGVITGEKDCSTTPFIRTNDGFLFDVENSCEESKTVVWYYAYQHKAWLLDPKTFDKFLAKGYYVYPVLQLKTSKGNVVIGSQRYMKDLIKEEPTLFFNKHGTRTKKEGVVTSLNDLLM